MIPKPYPIVYEVDGIKSRLFGKNDQYTVFPRKIVELLEDHSCFDNQRPEHTHATGDMWHGRFDDREVDLDVWMKYGSVVSREKA